FISVLFYCAVPRQNVETFGHALHICTVYDLFQNKMENVEQTIKKAIIDDLWRQALKALIARKNTTYFKQLLREEAANSIFPNMLRNLQRSMLTSDVYFKLHELAQLGDLNYDLVRSFRDTVYGAED
ncbi:unnamed protein product, partial [Owenia fusiformis]